MFFLPFFHRPWCGPGRISWGGPGWALVEHWFFQGFSSSKFSNFQTTCFFSGFSLQKKIAHQELYATHSDTNVFFWPRRGQNLATKRESWPQLLNLWPVFVATKSRFWKVVARPQKERFYKFQKVEFLYLKTVH